MLLALVPGAVVNAVLQVSSEYNITEFPLAIEPPETRIVGVLSFEITELGFCLARVVGADIPTDKETVASLEFPDALTAIIVN